MWAAGASSEKRDYGQCCLITSRGQQPQLILTGQVKGTLCVYNIQNVSCDADGRVAMLMLNSEGGVV